MISVDDDLNYGYDTNMLKNSYRNYKEVIYKNSELINTARNIFRVIRGIKMSGGDRYIDISKLENLKISDDLILLTLEKHKQFIKGYQERLNSLITTSVANGIYPILVTQPLLWGDGIDPATGINLAELKINKDQNGKLQWKVLEKYNDVTRLVAKEQNILLIDLATLMPKDSLYFYDNCHYTNSGAKQVAEIIYNKLYLFLKLNYPQYINK
jgi:hypothetical protein